MRHICFSSRESTSAMMTRQQITRIVFVRSNRVESTTFFNQPCVVPDCYVIRFSCKSTSATVNRKQEKRFVSIWSNRQHFQPTLYRPGTLYFLSISQIDFRYNESTARETTRVDSFESNRIDNIFNPQLYFLRLFQIDFRYNESTAGETIRVDSFESSRIDNIFSPPCIDPERYNF